MKNQLIRRGKAVAILLVAVCGLSQCHTGAPNKGKTVTGKDDFSDRIVEKVPFQQVTISDHFWRPKIEINRLIGIRNALHQASQSIEIFDIAAGKSKATHKASLASDSDVYKIIQGAAYALHHTADKELELRIDSIIDRIVAAQQPDGYLFTYWTINDPSQRWKDIGRKHELYCAGHMFEAAAAYYEATGKRKFLDAAVRFADHIDSVFGPDKRREAPGHQEVELALIKLYEVTGERRYLDLAVFFVDERGNPMRMDAEKITPPDKDPHANTPNRWRPPSYMQDHLPVTSQFYATGHAVRAGYLYSAMADIAVKTKDTKYLPALDSIWNDIVGRKMYITGGVGTRQFHDEGFGAAYLLPNDQAYCETCSSIALNFWNRRMNLLHADSKYADLVELTMYNSVISSLSLSGDKTFYTNPLESNGKRERNLWHNPPCCPSNLVRFLPEIGSTIYGTTDHGIYINQFIGSEANFTVAGNEIKLILETDYPWEGKVSLQVDPEKPADFSLHIRIPGWARGELLPGGLYKYLNSESSNEEVILRVNGERVGKIQMERGYAIIERKWQRGDKLELEIPMTVQLMVSNPKIEANRNKVVLARGPMIYCMEEVDNKDYFEAASEVFVLPAGLKAEYQPDLLEGVVCLNGLASSTTKEEKINITAIPYYAWCNRELGRMKVWLPFLEND